MRSLSTVLLMPLAAYHIMSNDDRAMYMTLADTSPSYLSIVIYGRALATC